MNFAQSERIAEIFKPYVDVTVRNAIMHRTWEEGQYTSYAIYLETNHCAFTLENSCVRRRYSEFTHLRNLLSQQHPNIKGPALPPKALFENKFGVNFIEKRRCGLEGFLQKVFTIPLYLSNRTVHLFAQSNLPMHRIELIVDGRSGELIQCEPHLILNQQSISESDVFSESSDLDLTDLDMYSHQDVSTASLNCSTCIKHKRSHSHVSQGAKITICTPSLHVPQPNCNQHSQSFSISNSQDSDYYSVLATSSPVLQPQITYSLSNDSLVIPAPAMGYKKKVSFSNEILQANNVI